MRIVEAGAILIAAMPFAGPALAADLSGPDMPPMTAEQEMFETRWEVTAAPYVWALSLNGTTRFGDLPKVDIDASFSDILDSLNFAVMAAFEARNDRFGIFGDLLYADVSAGGSYRDDPFRLKANLGSQLFIGTLGVDYRVVESGRSSLDVMAGARLYSVSADAKVTLSVSDGSLPPISAKQSSTNTWVDPMIGIKGKLQGASPWFLTGWGMVGGFGVASDFAWDAFAGVGYELGDRWSLTAGYRGLGVDYQTKDFLFDVTASGPIIGAAFRF